MNVCLHIFMLTKQKEKNKKREEKKNIDGSTLSNIDTPCPTKKGKKVPYKQK